MGCEQGDQFFQTAKNRLVATDVSGRNFRVPTARRAAVLRFLQFAYCQNKKSLSMHTAWTGFFCWSDCVGHVSAIFFGGM
ncbi:hypothetical protein TH8_09525 [Thalassospira profundimaris]|nr:hypothetical protein TH8_09525 [Thalassospira profundimaris]